MWQWLYYKSTIAKWLHLISILTVNPGMKYYNSNYKLRNSNRYFDKICKFNYPQKLSTNNSFFIEESFIVIKHLSGDKLYVSCSEGWFITINKYNMIHIQCIRRGWNNEVCITCVVSSLSLLRLRVNTLPENWNTN